MRDKIRGFLIGLVAGIAAIIFSFFLRIFAGGLFIPELAAQAFFSLIPGTIESQAVETLGSLAKYLTFLGAIVINLVFYGVLGTFLHGLYERLVGKGYLVRALQLSLLAYSVLLVMSIILLRATEVLSQPISTESVALYLLPPHIAFGFVLTFLYGREVPRPTLMCETVSSEIKIDHKRRLIIRTAVAGAIASTILFYGLDLLFPKSAEPSKKSIPDQAEPPIEPRGRFADPAISGVVASELTPNDKFYRVDVNVVTPTVDPKAWKLTVKGLVNNPLALTYEELTSMRAVEQYSTLECVSNKIGGDLISNALWRGVPLKNIFEKAQVRPEAAYIVFRCYDGYDVGIPMERALLDGTILAFEMNGVPLPEEHGYPLRAVVPGLYGMMNAKWITEIELVNRVHEGFWQRRGWSNTAEYQTHSMVVMPGDSQVRERFGNLRSSKVMVGGKVPVAGISFAGDRGISKVEVSTDGGKNWEEASIKDPLSDYTWVLWAADWNPPARGEYKISVRATDRTGNLQTAELRNPFPSGATGYHVVDIKVT